MMPQYGEQNVNPNQYTPWHRKLKNALGLGAKDIVLPAEGKTPSRSNTLTPDSARGIVKGFKQVRELAKPRSQSKR
jgi:hypothetical protein